MQYSGTDQPDEARQLQTMPILEEQPPFVDIMLEDYEMGLLQVSRLSELLDGTHSDYPFDNNFEEARHETIGRLTYLWHHWLSQANYSDS